MLATIPTKENIIKIMEGLSPELRQTISSRETAKDIENAVLMHKIPAEKIKGLVSSVGYVLLGLYNHEEFTKDLSKDLGIDPLIARDLAIDIDRSIFLPIRDEIKKAHKIFKEGGIKKVEKVEEIKKIEEIKKETIIPQEKKFEEKKFEKKIFPKSFAPKKIGPMVDIKKQEEVRKEFKPISIRGEEAKVKPTLQTKSPISSVFEQVEKKKEEVVSRLEIKKDEPTKIVNFTADNLSPSSQIEKKPGAVEKTTIPSPKEMADEGLMMEKKLEMAGKIMEKKVGGIIVEKKEKEEKKIETMAEKEKEVGKMVIEKKEELETKAIAEEKTKEKENIINLKKLKF